MKRTNRPPGGQAGNHRLVSRAVADLRRRALTAFECAIECTKLYRLCNRYMSCEIHLQIVGGTAG
ncbi:hypothetical protein [Paenibacillus agricola]|uniref:hypothetical protein n=1 Tax=Paenibacillus agricola TaxID=2716264 RepID=UPI001A9D841E|nr:hypothetical protein [Paenibacillus agricola]